MDKSNIVYFDVGDIWPIVLVFVVSGIGIGYGLQVTGEIRDETCTDGGGFAVAGRCQVHPTVVNATYGYTETAQFNGTVQTIAGVKKFPEKFDTLATVILAALVIGILWRYLSPGRL